jgi:hypothetical protein
MVLRLYYDAMSQPSRALLIFLRANASVIPFEEVPIALRKGQKRCFIWILEFTVHQNLFFKYELYDR